MKRFLSIIGLGLFVCLAAYAGVYFFGTAQVREVCGGNAPELGWLKLEFKLSDAEFSRISELHSSYQSRCAELCRRIDKKNIEVKEALASAGEVTPEIAQKLSEAAALRVECQKSMLQHFFMVSRSMPPEQGRRYLAWVEQKTFLPMNSMSASSPHVHAHDH